MRNPPHFSNSPWKVFGVGRGLSTVSSLTGEATVRGVFVLQERKNGPGGRVCKTVASNIPFILACCWVVAPIWLVIMCSIWSWHWKVSSWIAGVRLMGLVSVESVSGFMPDTHAPERENKTHKTTPGHDRSAACLWQWVSNGWHLFRGLHSSPAVAL